MVLNKIENISSDGGTLSINLDGGANPYAAVLMQETDQYSEWVIENSTSIIEISDLPNGNYTLLITDANECSKEISFEINSTIPVILETANSIICEGDVITISSTAYSGNLPI